MIFPHAFQKMLVAKAAPGDDPVVTSGNSDDLTAGQIGIIGPTGNALVDITSTSDTYANYHLFQIVQGSFSASDTLGNSLHGGYKRTVKSKPINPKYISSVFQISEATSQTQVIKISAGVNCDSIECNTTYDLRIDLKGSPILRALQRNDYLTAYYNTGCCDSSSTNIDPNLLNLGWADYINADPLMSNFIEAKAWNLVYSDATVDTTSGSTTISIAIDDLLSVGDMVVGVGIPDNTTIDSFSATSAVLSNAATADGTNIAVKFYTPITTASYEGVQFVYLDVAANTNTNTTLDVTSSANLTVGDNVYGAGIPTGTTIASIIDATHIELSAAATATATITAVFSSPSERDTATNDCFLTLEQAYVDTSFGDCSFNPNDFHEKAPIRIYASVYSKGVCVDNCYTVSEIQPALNGKGYGETIIRELIQDKRQNQQDFKTNPRLREILGDTSLTEISRKSKYNAIYILHSIPRKSNPSGMMDNDQYLVKVVYEAGTTTTNLVNLQKWIVYLMNSAGNGLVASASAFPEGDI